jgi:uncharacterized protein
MSKQKYAGYKPAAPYFDSVRGALGDVVVGEHFFDILANDIAHEVRHEVSGFPRAIHGRSELMAQLRGYVENGALRAVDKLITHNTGDGSVVVMEYEAHGTILAIGTKYNKVAVTLGLIGELIVACHDQQATSRLQLRYVQRRDALDGTLFVIEHGEEVHKAKRTVVARTEHPAHSHLQEQQRRANLAVSRHVI